MLTPPTHPQVPGVDVDLIEELLAGNRGAMEPTVEQLLVLSGGDEEEPAFTRAA